jgi:hypothetical protein
LEESNVLHQSQLTCAERRVVIEVEEYEIK